MKAQSTSSTSARWCGFTYIDDIVEGLIRLTDKVPPPDFNAATPDSATSNAPCRGFNIGKNRPTPLMEYIQTIEIAVEKTAQKNHLSPRPGDVPATAADIDGLDAWVGFKPDTVVSTGVARFVEWHGYYSQKYSSSL